MNTIKHSPAGRLITRIKSVCEELSYAQRRLLEIQTGVPLQPRSLQKWCLKAQRRFR
jgi:hypothetical protein